MVPVAYTSAPLRMNGQVVGTVVTFRDVTERKRAEEALRQSEEQYRRIVETANEGIIIVDADDNIAFANQQMAEMLGYTVDEILGRPMDAFLDEEGRQIFEAAMERRRRGIKEQSVRKYR